MSKKIKELREKIEYYENYRERFIEFIDRKEEEYRNGIISLEEYLKIKQIYLKNSMNNETLDFIEEKIAENELKIDIIFRERKSRAVKSCCVLFICVLIIEIFLFSSSKVDALTLDDLNNLNQKINENKEKISNSEIKVAEYESETFNVIDEGEDLDFVIFQIEENIENIENFDEKNKELIKEKIIQIYEKVK